MATFGTTLKHALRVLQGTSLVSEIDAGFEALADDLDAIIAVDDQGTVVPVSTLGAPGKKGRYYFKTDTGQLFRDNGTGWDEIPIGAGQRREVGDYKYSIQSASHGSLGGGLYAWLLADNSELAAGYTSLISVLTAVGSPFGTGPNGRPRLPDFRGRMPIAVGTNSAVNALGDNEGEAIANRKPQHDHTADAAQMNTGAVGTGGGADRPASGQSPARAGGFTFPWGAVADGPTDGPAYLVGGRWFIKS